jgi:hypothetical protein
VVLAGRPGAWDARGVRVTAVLADGRAAQDVRVIARSMDVIGQRNRYGTPDSAHKVVLQHLLERIDECVTDLGKHALSPPDRGQQHLWGKDFD